MQGVFIPKEIEYMSRKLDVTRNTFFLETSGQTSVNPNGIVTIHMPESSLIDLKSFRVFFDCSIASQTSGGKTVNGRVDRTEDLLQSVELYAGGVQLSHITDFNSMCRLYKIPCANRTRESTIGNVISGGALSEMDDTAEDASMVIEFGALPGLFSSSSVRYMSTNIVGPITIRLTFASAAVLALKQSGRTFADGFEDSADTRTAAAAVTFTLSNLHATCSTLNMGEFIDRMVNERLASEEHLKIKFLDYYTFNHHNESGSGHTMRFSLSSESIENVLTGMRFSNYQNNGIQARLASAASTGDVIPQAFFFDAMNDQTKKNGSMRYQYSANNVNHPQFLGTVTDAAMDLALLADKVDKYSSGYLIRDLHSFQKGQAAFPLILNLPGQPKFCATGQDSRGQNVNYDVKFTNLTAPTAATQTQIVATISTFVAACVMSEIRVASNRQLAVAR